MTILCHVPVGFPAIAYSPRLPLWYPQLHEALCSHLGFLPLFSEVLPAVLSTRAMPVPQSSRQFQALPCWFWPACRLCSGSPCSESFQANPHRPVPFLPDCQRSALPHTLRVPHYLFVGSPPLCGISVHHADFLLRVFFNTSTQMRLQDLPGYSHVLFLFTCRIYRKAIPCSDWALFCYANLPSPPALYAISVRQARALPIRGTFNSQNPAFFRFRPTADTLAFG